MLLLELLGNSFSILYILIKMWVEGVRGQGELKGQSGVRGQVGVNGCKRLWMLGSKSC